MLSLLRRLFSGRPDPVPGYRIFTRKYDLVADARSYANRLPRLTAEEAAAFEAALEDFRVRTSEWRAFMAPALAAAVERIRNSCDRAALADATVTLLVDHSGSLRGWGLQSMTLVVPLLEALVTAVGMDVEVLGYTTRSWKGGSSRQLWLARGRLPGPGRLCDLLHLVYRPAGDPRPADMSLMLRPGLVKENIDGEAVLWAVERLRAQTRRRRLLLVVSDGAPVDDATLSANPGTYLEAHLKAVLALVAGVGDVVIAGIGVAHDLGGYYRTSCVFTNDAEMAERVLPFVESRILALADG